MTSGSEGGVISTRPTVMTKLDPEQIFEGHVNLCPDVGTNPFASQ